MEMVQPETYKGGGGNGWPGARCSDAARRDATLLPEAWCDLYYQNSELFLCFSLPQPIPALLKTEADKNTDKDVGHFWASKTWLCRIPRRSRSVFRSTVEAYGHCPSLWGCTGAVLTNPGPCGWHGRPEIQKSGMWSLGARKPRASPGSQSQDRSDDFVQMHPGSPGMTPCIPTRYFVVRPQLQARLPPKAPV